MERLPLIDGDGKEGEDVPEVIDKAGVGWKAKKSVNSAELRNSERHQDLHDDGELTAPFLISPSTLTAMRTDSSSSERAMMSS